MPLTEHGLWFRPPSGCRIRTEKLAQVILHWTGGEGSALSVFRTLEARHLGVHYVVDAGGLVWQMCDETHAAYHAGGGNERSIGIEIVYSGIGATKGRKQYAARRLLISDYSDRQNAAVIGLVEDIVARHGLPRRVPVTFAGVLPGVERWGGVCGHLHWSARKTDPGPRIFERLMEAGYDQG